MRPLGHLGPVPVIEQPVPMSKITINGKQPSAWAVHTAVLYDRILDASECAQVVKTLVSGSATSGTYDVDAATHISP